MLLNLMQVFAQEVICSLIPCHTKWSKMMQCVVCIKGCERPWIKSNIFLCQAWGMIGCALPANILYNRVILDIPRVTSCCLRHVIAVLYAPTSKS